MAMHDDQLEVSLTTVEHLIAHQFSAWAGLRVRPVETAGTVNAIFRIGDALAARFPLQPGDPEDVLRLLNAEAEAAREFAAASPFPAPEPLAIGEPGDGYPLPWSIQTWLPGSDAIEQDPTESPAFADDLAELITCLRRADIQGRRFTGEGRGGHLPDHDAWMDECFVKSEGLVDVRRLRALWDELRTLPAVDADVMCHGDLTPTNVLVGKGRLVGVLDTGGFAAADPALDLVAVWHLLGADSRQRVRDALGSSDTQWRRGMAWALQQAMGLVWYYATTNPVMSRWGQRTLDRLLGAAS